MKEHSVIIGIIIVSILLSHIIFSYYLLMGIAEGRYPYHVDNAWRALSAYKWTKAPFITYNPVRFPLEFTIYGIALTFWGNIPLALATVTIAFSTGIVFFIFLITYLLLHDNRAAIISSLLAAFIPGALQASIGCMSEIIMCFWVLAGSYFYLRFEQSLPLKPPTSSWRLLYISSIFFFLSSAQRAEGWGFVVCYLLLLVILYIKKRKQAGSMLPSFKKHLLICAAISILFIPFYMIYSYLRSEQVLRFVDHYLIDFTRQGQVAPRLLIYPLYLFRLEPLLLLMSLPGIFYVFAFKRRLLSTYLIFFCLSFISYELSTLIIGADLMPTRAILIIAFLLCPLAGACWAWAWSKASLLGILLIMIVLINLVFNLPKAIQPVRRYAKWESDVDLLGKHLRHLTPPITDRDNILVELGDNWPVPVEYYLFYYLPENLAFDKSGAWGPYWKEVLFTRSFKETYLGYPGKKWPGDKKSLFDLSVFELKNLLLEREVPLVVTFSDQASRKIAKIYPPVGQIGRYRIFARQ